MIENYNPESLIIKDEICSVASIEELRSGERYVSPWDEQWDEKPYGILDIEKLSLIDDIILGKIENYTLDFDKNRFLAECLVKKSLLQHHRHFTPTKDGLKKLLNFWCESGNGLPWENMPEIFYKHLTFENFSKQYAGLISANHSKKEILVEEYSKYNQPEVNFKDFFNINQYNFEDLNVLDSVILIDEIVCAAEKLKIKIDPIFEDPTCDFFQILEQEFDDAVKYISNKNSVEETTRIVKNFRKIFTKFYEPFYIYEKFLK